MDTKLICLFMPRSRGSTHRSVATPEGRPDSEAVRNGNILACRCFILLLIAACKGANWIMEQPGTSLMEYLPCFQALMGLVSVRKMTLSLADFGSPTVKRTILYSSTWSRWQRFLIAFNPNKYCWNHLKLIVGSIHVKVPLNPLNMGVAILGDLAVVWRHQVCPKSHLVVSIRSTNLGSDCVDSLADFKTTRKLRPREMVKRYKNKAGQDRVCGGKHLRASQH